MRNASLIFGLFLGLSVATLRAGSVFSLADGSETDGKLTLSPGGLHVEGGSGSDLNLTDILEADFSDAPFHRQYFSSAGDHSTPLPPNWNGRDIGQVNAPGSVSYAAGVFTLTGDQWDPPPNSQDRTDHYFVTGLPWTGDGQWSVRVKSIDGDNARAGIMLRESLDPLSVGIGVSASSQNVATPFNRNTDHNLSANDITVDNLPLWFRITRRGPSIDLDLSRDDKQWKLLSYNIFTLANNMWAGFFIGSHTGKAVQKAVFDQALFTPAPGPSPGRIVPTGVLLRSGGFVAGYFSSLDFDNKGPDPVGHFRRNDKFTDIPIAVSQISAVIYHPMPRSQLTALGSQVGVLMKNGDFMTGNFEAINTGDARLNSVLLGTQSYDRDAIGACMLNSVQPMPANYEVRLKDGSCILTNGISVSNGHVAIDDAAGVAVPTDPDDIALFRAGPGEVQTLIDLPWKATPPPAPTPPPVPAPPASPAAATNAAPAANPAPAPNQAPPVECWVGPNQEQIMAVPTGTIVDFPLTGKFHAVALRVALSPDSPPNSQAIIRILADGREVARTPDFRAGDQPRFMEVTVSDPQTVTLVANSMFGGVRVLVIDPVAIRESAASDDAAPAP
jgi:hypothetical protein